MRKFQLVLFLCIIAFFNQSIIAQEHETNGVEKHEQNEHHKKHAISIILSHTYIKSGVKNNVGDKWLALPSFGINYNYNFNEKWAIGLHNDIIVEEFIVEDPNAHDSEVVLHKNEEPEVDGIKRSHPIASAIMLTYKPHEHIALLAGGGMEFSKEENFALIRLGAEFPFEIPNDWEIFGAMSYDINIDAYNGFTFGFGIAKLF